MEDEGPQTPLTSGRGTPSSTPKGEQLGGKRTVPSTPGTGGADKDDNAKKRKLNWHSKFLQAAAMQVKFLEEGKGGGSQDEDLVFWITVTK